LSVERYSWNKPFFIPRALPGFAIPTTVAESEANSTLYHLEGLQRRQESESVVFQFTLSGEGRFTKGDRTYPVSEGMGFLTEVSDPDIVYCYPEGATKPWRFIFLTFKDPLQLMRPLTKALGHVFSVPMDDLVIRRLREFGKLNERTIELTAGEGHLLVNGLLARLADGARSNLAETTHVRLIRQAERLIRENMDRPYNAGMLACDIGISQEHLCRIFRSEVGTTPLSYLNETKIRRACELLRTTSMSCRNIAESLGYDPGSHFARLFKRVTSLTPQEFRKRGIIAF
jgi:AraC-like DNA-binding protein